MSRPVKLLRALPPRIVDPQRGEDGGAENLNRGAAEGSLGEIPLGRYRRPE